MFITSLKPSYILIKSILEELQSDFCKNLKEFYQISLKHLPYLIDFSPLLMTDILDYFQSINGINVSIHGCNCCKTGIKVSKCVYLASMAVKREHTCTVGGHNHDILQQCISMFIPAEVWGLNQNKNCQNTCFCSSITYLHTRGEQKVCALAVNLFNDKRYQNDFWWFIDMMFGDLLIWCTRD